MVRLEHDREADFLYKGPGLFQRLWQAVAGDRNACPFIVLFHGGL